MRAAAAHCAGSSRRGLLAPGLSAAALSVLAAAAPAQTPAPVSVANDLRACISGTEGFRDGPHLGELQKSLEAVPNKYWTGVTEIAPGVTRLTSAHSDITVELRLPDASGSGHCLAFGPSLRQGDGARTADTFVEFNFLPGFAAAETPAGYTRRYVFPDLSYTVELVAFQTPDLGEVVGFTFAGVPQDLKTRELSAGDPNVSPDYVRAIVAWATQVCALTMPGNEQVRKAIEDGGFEYGHANGGNPEVVTYFLPDNSVSATVGGYTCTIDTRYLGAPEATALVDAMLRERLAGRFQRSAQTFNGACAVFSNIHPGHGPLVISVGQRTQSAQRTCVDDGTTRIWFEVPG